MATRSLSIIRMPGVLIFGHRFDRGVGLAVVQSVHQNLTNNSPFSLAHQIKFGCHLGLKIWICGIDLDFSPPKLREGEDETKNEKDSFFHTFVSGVSNLYLFLAGIHTSKTWVC